ncbi:MAG: protein kinase domain-containing protein [Planctomycetota bacterium]|jgi:serine/threonine protein kinase
MASSLLIMLAICFGAVLGILAIIFLVVPLLKGIGWMIGGLFNALGWLLRHVFEFIGGMLKDTVRFVGAIIAWLVLIPLVLLNIVIGRWSAAGHFFRSMKREVGVGTTCLYRVALQRPLRFVLLGGLLEGLEERVNEAWEAAPTSDKPRRRAGKFDGYTIVGSLPGGGSGAKLYVAEPDKNSRRKGPDLPPQVVIKSFTLTDGSSLPQIVRESRALEPAKQMGLVLDHGMDEHRFFYVMPYHHGDHLGIITRQLHGRSDGRGLSGQHLAVGLGYARDLLATLSRYHGAGLWHKDVKPDNIIVHDGRAHLVDLGLVTPLRSAMTLTTHGTEYFRDPEMVRMALRGVKVHQVDGAKFDIYAVGAVLYFVLENTFPAHGGLSAFSKKSPEAARWIIRRSMADYNKRYETAAQMLADLDYAAAASDAFAVKPADLPSMRGGDAVPLDEPAEAPEVEVMAAAGSPVPPKEPQRGEPRGEDVKVEVAGWGVKVDSEGVEVGKFGQEPVVKVKRKKPRIQVTNWWTGAYEVQRPDGRPVEDVAGMRSEARAMRDEVRGFRSESEAMRKNVHMGRMTARRAAREQIKQARARAKEMQRRARTHRHRAVREDPRQPSGMMAFMGLVVLLMAAAAIVGLLNTSRARNAGVREQGKQPPVAGPLSLLLINDHPAGTNERVQYEIKRIVDLHRQQGWEVVLDADAEVDVRTCLPAGSLDPMDPNPQLRKTLGSYDLGGILRIRSFPGEGEPSERIKAVMIAVPKAREAPLVHLEVQVPGDVTTTVIEPSPW